MQGSVSGSGASVTDALTLTERAALDVLTPAGFFALAERGADFWLRANAPTDSP